MLLDRELTETPEARVMPAATDSHDPEELDGLLNPSMTNSHDIRRERILDIREGEGNRHHRCQPGYRFYI